MSELKVNKVSPVTGTELTLGDSGDTIDLSTTTVTLPANSVDSDQYVDGSIDLIHLQTGTDGELITWDASGNPAAVSTGTATHVLTSGGTGVAPTFQAAAAGGAWTVIESTEASDTASITFTGIDSTYDTYVITISDCVPVSDNNILEMRVGDSSGIDSGNGDYQFFLQQTEASESSFNGYGSNSNSSIQLARSVGSAAGEGVVGILYLHKPSDGSTMPNFTGHILSSKYDGGWWGGSITAQRKSAIAIDRLQFFASSGNIASGRITLYGIAHA